MGIKAAKDLITEKIKSAALEEKEHYTEKETAMIHSELIKEGGSISIVAQNLMVQLERKRSKEQALLLDNIENQIWCLTDKKTYGIVNEAHAEFLGLEKEELEGRDLYDIISVENSIDCIWVLDKKLRFTYLSPSAERIMGSKPEQLVGTRLNSHFRTKEFLKVGALAVKNIKNYNASNHVNHVTFETKMLNSNKDEVNLEISSKVLLNSQGKLIGLQGTTRDITERKQAKEALQESEEKFRKLT